MGVALRVREASFAYPGGRPVLHEIDVTVEAGRIACVLGPNGCGKSTLLKCIAGMLRPHSGSIEVDGQSIDKMPRHMVARLVGYIPQEHVLSFPYTVEQVVVMGRAPYLRAYSAPNAGDHAVAEAAMERVGIAGLRHRRYTEISGGERQLALIARVLAQEPRLLLLDEPASHLDFKNQACILDLVRSCAQAGMAVVMTSHFPNHALAVATDIHLMKGGRLIAQGPTQEVINEANLSALYDVPVRIYAVTDPATGQNIRFCAAQGGYPA